MRRAPLLRHASFLLSVPGRSGACLEWYDGQADGGRLYRQGYRNLGSAELILRIPALSPHYLLEVTREGHLDSMTVHVESACGSRGSLVREAAAQELTHHVKSYVGITVRVQIDEPGSIERSIGKAKRVLDRRDVRSPKEG